MYLPRRLEKTFIRLNAAFPVIMVTGPRQSGKTTLLQHLGKRDRKEGRRFVSLDDLDMRRLAREDPKLFIASFPPPLGIDEFQYAPELLSYIKISVDELTTTGNNADAAGMYWLTGSQHFVLMKHVRESLAGRVAILELVGMDPAEAEGLGGSGNDDPFFSRTIETLVPWSKDPSPRAVFGRIIGGGMPALLAGAADEEVRRRYYSSYVQTYLERDVAVLDGVRNLRAFELFFRLLAGRAGRLVNFTELSKEVGVSAVTVRDWMEILERSFHIVSIGPFFNSFSKRLVKSPKVYFLDSGLHAWLTGWQDPETALRGPLAGQLFENWVMGLLVRSAWHRGRESRLSFWRTRTGQELDIFNDEDGRIDAGEIKLASGGLGESAGRIFAPLDSIDPKPFTWGRRFVFSLSDGILPLAENTWQIPARYID
jgi:hypothetical protein